MYCSQCDKEATVENGDLKKTCVCDAPVVASMEATCEGTGGIEQ